MATGLRRRYVHLYCLITSDRDRVRGTTDGRMMAWSDFATALKAAAGTPFLVTNLAWFRAHVLPGLKVCPTAILVVVTHKDHAGAVHYHAEMDADDEELRTLCITTASQWARAPLRTAKDQGGCRVWRIAP